MNKNETFGPWLKRRRKSLDLTQIKFAHLVGCSAAAIRKFESEERKPSIQICEKLAEIFEIPQNEFKDFCSFSRGDWQKIITHEQDINPWQQPHAVKTNLPAATTPFIGRQTALREIQAYLVDENIRLVTIVGPPGLGKTRLSFEIANHLMDNFEGGIFFISLLMVKDASQIIPSILHEISFTLGYPISDLDELKLAFSTQGCLFLLDDFEHLINQGTNKVLELLTTCSKLKILITSREALLVPGEWIYPLKPLTTPDDSDLNDFGLDQLINFEAVQLFNLRAKAVDPTFSINSSNINSICQICKYLDGLPLAIELFATHIRIMTAEQLLDNISSTTVLHAHLLRGNADGPKTLFDSIEWSFRLLTEEERNLFARLSVFTGGFTLATIQTFFDQLDLPLPTELQIMSLYNKSFLNKKEDPCGGFRFCMLLTLVMFAREHLQKLTEEHLFRNHHLKFFCELAGQYNQHYIDSNDEKWLQRMQSEFYNFQTALEWGFQQNKFNEVIKILESVYSCWIKSGHTKELLHWMERFQKDNVGNETYSRFNQIFPPHKLGILSEHL